jgi:hypothetical protein
LCGTRFGYLNDVIGRGAIDARVSGPIIWGWSARPSCRAMTITHNKTEVGGRC